MPSRASRSLPSATARRRNRPTERDGFLRTHVAERVLALIDGPLAGRQRERRVIDGGVRLDGVRQGVDAAVGRHLRRAGHRQQRIDDGDARPQVIAEDADLDVVVACRSATAAADTSEPVPAVVGTQMSGVTGPGILSSPR